MLDLPRELRNEVFRHLFQTPSSSFRLGTNSGRSPPNIRWFALSKQEDECLRGYLSLSLTCRQIRNEAAEIFYELNTFKTFAAVGIQELPAMFVRRLQRLELYGFKECPNSGDGSFSCEYQLCIVKEKGDVAVKIAPECSRKYDGFLVDFGIWEQAAAAMRSMIASKGALTTGILEDLLINLGRVTHRLSSDEHNLSEEIQ